MVFQVQMGDGWILNVAQPLLWSSGMLVLPSFSIGDHTIFHNKNKAMRYATTVKFGVTYSFAVVLFLGQLRMI